MTVYNMPTCIRYTEVLVTVINSVAKRIITCIQADGGLSNIYGNVKCTM
jgi:hypothetical protein